MGVPSQGGSFCKKINCSRRGEGTFLSFRSSPVEMGSDYFLVRVVILEFASIHHDKYWHSFRLHVAVQSQHSPLSLMYWYIYYEQMGYVKQKRPSNMRKMREFRSYCACAKYHPGHCSPFIHSVNGQWRCPDQTDGCGLPACARRRVFAIRKICRMSLEAKNT